MIRRLPIPLPYWLLSGILLGLIIGFKSYIPFLYWGEEYVWQRYALPHLINYSFWPFFIPFIYWSLDHFPIHGSWPQWIKCILWGLLLAFIHEALTNLIYFGVLDYFDWYPWSAKAWKELVGAFPSVLIGRYVEYWIIYALLAAIDFRKKYQDKQLELAKVESQLSQAQLNALRMQLHPHFLFNTLNSISSLMDFDTGQSKRVIARLGNLLRRVLDQGPAQKVPLEQELNFLKDYLDIEQTRFQDRLKVTYRIAPDTQSLLIPPFITQPLIENTIKHNVALSSRPIHVEIESHFVESATWEWVIRDDGKGTQLPVSELLDRGIGLTNVNKRLEALYAGRVTLKIQSEPGMGFEVSIRFPVEKGADPLEP